MRLKQIGSAGNKTRRYHERPNETSNMEVKETMKVAITAKRVVILMMTMALAVAMVACEAAAGKPGERGPTGEPAKQPPYVVLELPDLPGLVQGMSDTVDLSKAFGDPDGKTLTLSATSNDPATATASVSGTTLTVTGVKVGTTAVVVTATDADDLSVSQSVQVTVTAAPPEPDPPVTIDDVKAKYPTLVITPTTAADVSKEIELPVDHTLISEDSTVVKVAKKAAAAGTPASSIQWASATANDTTAKNVWVITAVKQGITDVDVLDKSKASVHTIRVTVTTDPPAPEPDPVAPTKTTDIRDYTLYKDDGAQTITLADHFSHDGDITYTVESGVPGVVAATEADGILALTPIAVGNSRVTVTAMADGLSVSDDFNVEVKSGSKPVPVVPTPDAPMPVGTISPEEVEVGASLAAMDVSAYFTPTTGLIYTAASSDATKATATIPTGSSSLTIAGIAIGTATVTVTATDSDGRMATQMISVTVTDASAPYKPSTVMIAGVDKMRGR